MSLVETSLPIKSKPDRYGGPIADLTKLVAGPLHMGNRDTAASLLAETFGTKFKGSKPNTVEIEATLATFLQYLLDNERYSDAATLLWTPNLFTGEPRSVQMLFDSMFDYVTNMVPGAASMGKSYDLGVWHYLDWRRDPLFTSVQVIGPSENHLQRNLFSHLVRLHRQASIPFPKAEVMQLGITTDPHERTAGIFGVVIPLGKRSSGRLQGVKITMRPKPHPFFGPTSRLRVMLEEAENIPVGIWEDVTNIISNAGGTGTERFKICAPFNPKDPNGPCAQRCEPIDGWNSLDVETSEQWDSKRGWHVTRLDAYKSENVVLGTEKYFGLQTKEGLDKLIQNAGGVGTPGYYCADIETEVLSRRGWLRHDSLAVGDQVYTVNPETGLAEWNEVQEVFAKHFDGSLTEFDGRGFSALVTNNHRWAVVKGGKGKLRFKETNSLLAYDEIPLCRQPAQTGAVHDPAFALLAGLVIADGTVAAKNGKGNRITLYQSHKSNQMKCQLIRDTFEHLGVKYKEMRRADGISCFRFSGTVARRIRLAVKDSKKLLTQDFMESLDYESASALWRGLRLGDGGIAGGNNEYICTANEQQAGMYAALAARLGMPTTTHSRFVCSGGAYPNGIVSLGCRMWYVQARLSRHTKIKNISLTPTPYSGIVWCPRTANGTWYARRKGTTYFTGNTMARGWFPPTGVDLAVIPQHLMNDVVGEYIFSSSYEVCAGTDVALEGEDTAIMVLGRAGLSYGFRRPPTKEFPKGEVVEFKNAQGTRLMKYVVQVDSIFPLPKGDTTRLVSVSTDTYKGAKVNGDYVGVDRTGNGAGVHDVLLRTFHSGVKGINPSSSPTERRILEEDQKLPCDEYAWLISELWFALRKYIEYGFLKIHPNVPQDPLFHELTGRRFLLSGAKTKVESKKEYRSRGNRSPDRADALTIMLHAVRLNLAGPPSSTNTGSREGNVQGIAQQRLGSTDKNEPPL